MELKDLPLKIQDELKAERTQLCTKWKQNTPYRVVFTNVNGTRYFEACRVCEPYSDNKGNYMPFGGGSHWKVRYGKIIWDWCTNSVGEKEFYWVRSNQCFEQSLNMTIIKSRVATKKEVIEMAKAIGTLYI